MLNSESAKAKFPFSRIPENLLLGVGVGVASVVVELGDEVGVGETVGVAVGVGVIVGTRVGSPAPGQVWESRIPESEPLIVAKDPA